MEHGNIMASINKTASKVKKGRHHLTRFECFVVARQLFKQDRMLSGKRGIGNTGFHREGKSRTRQSLKGCCDG